jgi:hypothetical protein
LTFFWCVYCTYYIAISHTICNVWWHVYYIFNYSYVKKKSLIFIFFPYMFFTWITCLVQWIVLWHLPKKLALLLIGDFTIFTLGIHFKNQLCNSILVVINTKLKHVKNIMNVVWRILQWFMGLEHPYHTTTYYTL